MKRILIISLFLLLLVFSAACNGTDNDEISSNQETENSEQDQEENTDVEEEKNEEVEVETEDPKIEQQETVEPKYYISEENSSVLPIDEGTEENVVLLTIDDVPDQHALEMAKILKELEVGAIFFVNGHFIETEEKKEILKEIHDMGFIIGNHTYTHVNLSTIDGQEDKHIEEIVQLNDLIENIIGERPKFFRAPHGVNTDYSKEIVKQEKMVLMNWTYGYDYFTPYMDAEKLTKAMVTGEGPEADVPYSLLKPGANLLMHDREWTKDALKDIVLGLQSEGYEIVDPHLIKTIE